MTVGGARRFGGAAGKAARLIAAVLGLVGNAGCAEEVPFGRPSPESGATGGSGASSSASSSGGVVAMPTSCELSAQSRSYVGCDYWPTVTANSVWSTFDFAVVVANAGDVEAEVHVTGPDGFEHNEHVPTQGLATIVLPWVEELKGPDATVCGAVASAPEASVRVNRGAYHLVSSVPVTVHQFNALEYQGKGGPDGKDWSLCPGLFCPDAGVGCFSYSNDASLLLPSTAMTGTYRLAAAPTDQFAQGILMPSYAAITATQDGTELKVQAKGRLVGGEGIPPLAPGEDAVLMLDAGDVVELFGGPEFRDDFSGSLVRADKPVQVLTGVTCRSFPALASACDHIEESLFPAETLGSRYAITRPRRPTKDEPVRQFVLLVGNVDATTVAFDPPIQHPLIAGGKASLDAGTVLDFGQIDEDLVLTGDHEFVVITFQLSGSLVDPDSELGDPSQSLVTAVEQYRDEYVFLAPADYDMNFVNVIGPIGTTFTLDGVSFMPSVFKPIGDSGLGVARIELAPSGAHRLKASAPVGMQIYGYGRYTGYQVPGGLNLEKIAQPPIK